MQTAEQAARAMANFEAKAKAERDRLASAATTCEHCRWWDNSVQLDGARTETGLCRVRPPHADKRTGQAVWPFTEDVDWCASFVDDPTKDTAPSLPIRD
jgi:hypothetical protein